MWKTQCPSQCKKKNKHINIEEKEVKQSLIAHELIIYVENSKKSAE